MANTWIELDLETLRQNLSLIRKSVRPGAEIILVVKSEAYGHGMVEVSRNAWGAGVKTFAVARVEEGEVLRAVLPEARILVVGVVQADEVPTILERRLIPVVVSERHARELAREAAARLGAVQCHAGLDTGMGRIGFDWESAHTVLPRLSRLPGLKLTGICSHFAMSDKPGDPFSDLQAARFYKAVQNCREAGLPSGFRHISNSGGLLRTRAWDLDAVRPGILAYGYASGSSECPAIDCRPFLHWKTRVVQVKRVPAGFPVSYDSTYVTRIPSNLATIDVGYADGYSRFLSNRGAVLIGGKRCPVAGRVTMNLTVVDLGPETHTKEGDEVVLIGKQGRESIWADELARSGDTISYEILTSIRCGVRKELRPFRIR